MKRIIKVGEVFKHLTVIRELDRHIYPSGKTRRKFLFKCVCGKETSHLLNDVISGKSTACGCKVRSHGLSKNALYRVFANMKKRCENVGVGNYKYYGGRGIKCEWKSLEDFIKDMSSTYKEGLTLDRIDNSKNYCKSNCRWATMKVQNSNKRNNIIFNGETAREASRRLGGNMGLVRHRVRKGWSIVDAFTLPAKRLINCSNDEPNTEQSLYS